MKIIKQFICPLLFFFTLFACTKTSEEDKYYTLNGLVLDYDSQLPISNSQVYATTFCSTYCLKTIDSALTDGSGRVSFKFKINGRYAILQAKKINYLNQSEYYNFAYLDVERTKTDTIYLVRPSFINVTAHKTGTSLPQDTINLQVMGDNLPGFGETPFQYYRPLYRGKADAPDKIFNLQAAYSHNPGDLPFKFQKLYFVKEIIRNGSVLSTQTDSTNIIQFGTQNFTLNY